MDSDFLNKNLLDMNFPELPNLNPFLDLLFHLLGEGLHGTYGRSKDF